MNPIDDVASLRLYDDSDDSAVVDLSETFSGNDGGTIRTFDHFGRNQFNLEPDTSPGGGTFLSLNNRSNDYGIFLQTNNGGSGSPAGVFSGILSGWVFDTSQSGDASMSLWTDAVSSLEMLNEPGVANVQNAGPTAVSTIRPSPIISRTIVVPTNGYIVAIVNADLEISHVFGQFSWVSTGLSLSDTTLPPNQDMDTVLSLAAASGLYDYNVSSNALFNVGPGPTTVYFNAHRLFGGGECRIWDAQLTLMFFPTAYGSTQSNFAPEGYENPGNTGGVARGPMTPGEIQAERAQGEAFGNARVLKELADMQAKIEQLKKQIDTTNGHQSPVTAPKRRPEPTNNHIPADRITSPVSQKKETK